MYKNFPNTINGTGFYRLISIVELVVDATREQLKFISTLYMIPLGRTAALVQSLAEMRVTVYAASFSSTQSRGCSFIYIRIAQNTREKCEKNFHFWLINKKIAHLRRRVYRIQKNCKNCNKIANFLFYCRKEILFVYYS